MKWIDLKEREPKFGQLVVVLEPRWPDMQALGQAVRPTIWGKDSALYPLVRTATHWCPIPDVRPSVSVTDYERRRQNWPPAVRAEADALAAEMKTRAPRIEWRVEPTSMIRDVGIGEPDTASMKDPGLVTNFYAHGWRITGEFDTGVDVFTFSREITDEYFRVAAVDIPGYIAHEMAHALAHELLRGDYTQEKRDADDAMIEREFGRRKDQ
jgi:hypothetical protein